MRQEVNPGRDQAGLVESCHLPESGFGSEGMLDVPKDFPQGRFGFGVQPDEVVVDFAHNETIVDGVY